MPTISTPSDLRRAARSDLVDNILPYWARNGFDEATGGLAGMILDDGRRVDDGPRHVVIAARVLWTFAAAIRQLGEEASWRRAAERARAQLLGPFWDGRHNGVFWSIDAAGRVVSDRKQGYAQAFALYGLAEWHAATGDEEALTRAMELFELLDRHLHDSTHGGYLEAGAADWQTLEDLRLSEVEPNVPKTMNSTLHLLEAFTVLQQVRPDGRVRARLDELVRLFLDRICGPKPWVHCDLFFTADWRATSRTISFGHDIETCWLLGAAADVLGDPVPRSRVDGLARSLADAVLAHGVDTDGGVFYEAEDGVLSNPDKHWWPQAEAVVGFLHAHRLTGEDRYMDAALRCWRFVETRIIDHERGEWHPAVDRAGRPKPAYPEFSNGYKIGPWKCPYHNGRACLEILRRVPE